MVMEGKQCYLHWMRSVGSKARVIHFSKICWTSFLVNDVPSTAHSWEFPENEFFFEHNMLH
jgi:hypothetical protein